MANSAFLIFFLSRKCYNIIFDIDTSRIYDWNNYNYRYSILVLPVHAFSDISVIINFLFAGLVLCYRYCRRHSPDNSMAGSRTRADLSHVDYGNVEMAPLLISDSDETDVVRIKVL